VKRINTISRTADQITPSSLASQEKARTYRYGLIAVAVHGPSIPACKRFRIWFHTRQYLVAASADESCLGRCDHNAMETGSDAIEIRVWFSCTVIS
jgi:hypothetical protein